MTETPVICVLTHRPPTCNRVERHEVVKVANLTSAPTLRLAREHQLFRGRNDAGARGQPGGLQADQGSMNFLAYASLKVKEKVRLVDKQELQSGGAQVVASHVYFAQIGDGPLEIASQIL